MPEPAKPTSGQRRMGSRARANSERNPGSRGAGLWDGLSTDCIMRNPRTDDAYVHANTAAIAAHVSGQIIRLPIKDNQRVKKGDLLFVVDPRPYKLALDAARTKLNLTEIEIKTLQDTINSAAAQLAERKVEAANAKQYLDRIVPLHERDFVTENDVVEARNKLQAAEAGVASARSELEKAQDALGIMGDVNQRVRAAQEEIEDAQLNYDYCFVRAPFDGYVTNLNISEGQYANAGQPVLTLVDDRNWYVLAYFREDLLDRIRPGMRARGLVTELPGQALPRRSARYRMGTLSGEWRDRRRPAQRRRDFELGAP